MEFCLPANDSLVGVDDNNLEIPSIEATRESFNSNKDIIPEVI